MPLKRLDAAPPEALALEPGAYEWECPVCGTRLAFTVSPAERPYRVGPTEANVTLTRSPDALTRPCDSGTKVIRD